MVRLNDGFPIEGIVLDPTGSVPMHRQLYTKIREMILLGELPGNVRMPSSRTLSERLGVSRFTVVTALDQLSAEGYLRAVSGSGTFVESIPNVTRTKPQNSPDVKEFPKHKQRTGHLSKDANSMMWRKSLVTNADIKYLHMSAPDHRLFPYQIWSNLTKEVLSKIDTETACYRDSEHPTLLEEQISSQLAISRGIKCSAEEVVTTLGAHHAVSLITDLLLDERDDVAFEEPGMSAVRSIFQSRGCRVHPMKVDSFGAAPSTVNSDRIKLAFVTAAKQQPLTVSMPVRRKLELLDWAEDRDALIVEDDLGSEFRYQGRPIPPLKALDRVDRVVYIGAFSMSLLQTLRIGYMIMPEDLARKCRKLIQVRYRAMPQITEQITARFIEDGHYTRHLHKMRRAYGKRQKRLLQILTENFADTFFTPEYSAGFYNLCFYKNQQVNDNRILALCNKLGLGVEQLSYYYSNKQSPQKAMLIGFAASTEKEIEAGTTILHDCIRSV